jgi:plastocyanin
VTVPPAGLIEVATDNTFSPTRLTAPAGQPVTLTLLNQGSATHNWHLLGQQDADGEDIKTRLVPPGESDTITFSISEAGSYAFQDDVHPTEQRGILVITRPQ